MDCPYLLPLNQNTHCFTRSRNSSFPTTIPRKLTNHSFISKARFTPYPSVPSSPICSIWVKKQQTRAIDDLITNCSSKNVATSCLNRIYAGWLNHFNSSRILASKILVLYFIGLTFIGEASGDQNNLTGFACEDASHYYASVDHKEGEDLMRELNSIISPHRSLPYKQVWEALKILDADNEDNPEASSDVVEIYSLRAVSKFLAGKSEGWNREHLWPRSYGLNDGPSLSDLHNIRPADVNVNSSRGNKYFGECLANSTHCLKPANKEAAYDTETDKKRWTPPLQVRGDIARALMYMAVCYGFNQSDGSPNLHLSDSPSVGNREMGLLSTLLKWNELDPPSRTEQLRNNRVCTLYQHNRNPFVDHPEYANLIWGKDTLGGQTVNIPLKAWINEFHCNNKGNDKNETAVFHVTEGGSNFLIYIAYVPLQNGPADGIALVSRRQEDGHSQVIHFISYQGVVIAIDGPATVTKSVDIHTQNTEASTETYSSGLMGVPTIKFTWPIFKNKASPTRPNSGQSLSDCGS